MKKYKITSTIEEIIEAENRDLAEEKFWEKVERTPQQTITTYLQESLNIKEIEKKPYCVSYRNEIETLVEAESEDEALYKAEKSEKWKFILDEGHKDLFEVIELSK